MDLLLHLIEKRELDITEISLALVADRFLAYVAAMHTVNAGELADFCSVAARLLLIKSRYLLPRPRDEEIGDEEEDPAEELARQLREYKRYKQVAELLKEIEEAGVRCYPRVAPPPHFERPLKPGDNTLDELFSAFQRALKEHPQPGNANHVVAPVQVSMAECIARIENVANTSGRIYFSTLMGQAQSRLEIIVLFLAVLELIKQQHLSARQETSFGEVYLEKREPDEGLNNEPIDLSEYGEGFEEYDQELDAYVQEEVE